MPSRYHIASRLAAPPSDVWAHCSSMRGVGYELAPWLRMTYPKQIAELTEQTVRLGEPLFRSWLLLFGFIPVEWDLITLAELDPGRRFLERSSMATVRVWQHERVVQPLEHGCRVIDNLAWTGRFPGAQTLVGLAVPVLFRWRHRRLRARFGSARQPPGASDVTSARHRTC